MKGLCYHGARDIRCDTLPDPTIKDPGDILVRMIGCSICGSDLHIYRGHGWSPEPCYSVGHEAIGEVMEVGRAVRRHRPGDQVMISAAVGCGLCAPCLAGDINRCRTFDHMHVYGIGDGLEGIQSEAFVIPSGDSNAMKIPEGISHDQALMMTDMLPTAWLGAKNADIAPGDTVVVIGLGPIGLIAIEAAFAMGAAQVIAVGRSPDRLAIAQEMGARTVYPDDAVEMVGETTRGVMASSVIEAVGAQETVRQSIDLVRRTGTVSMVGVNLDPAFPFPMDLVLTRNITFRGALCSTPQYWDEMIPFVREGRIRPERLITHRVSLSEGGEAYRISADRQEGVLKTVMTP
ncbi:MAG: zinc-binding dehydrogenase [Sphingobium sp.]